MALPYRGAGGNAALLQERQKPVMRDTINSQYDTFLYWRLPIPELDLSELEHLGLAERPGYQPKGGYGGFGTDRKKLNRGEDEEEEVLLQYNSFNFWRAPLPSVSSFDFDLTI